MKTEEMIGCEDYYKLADYEYIGQQNLPQGIINCDISKIPELFQQIKGRKEKYIVISARSDFGLHYQKDAPVNADLIKAARIFGNNPNYFSLSARCNTEKCHIEDRYSIKCYMWTDSTFNEIPQNVEHWFLTNCAIEDLRITPIPFGINNVDGNEKNKDIIAHYPLGFCKREKLLYVNFQFYTLERAEAFRYYQELNSPEVTVEKNVSFDQYLYRLATHKFVLSPCGNGIDCYRNLESLYMGCVPIIENHPGLSYFDKTMLPHLYVDDLCMNQHIIQYLSKLDLMNFDWDLEEAKLSYWKQKIEDTRKKYNI